MVGRGRGGSAGEPDRCAARATARVLELRQRRDHWQRLRVSTATRVALCKGGGSSEAAKVMASAQAHGRDLTYGLGRQGDVPPATRSAFCDDGSTPRPQGAGQACLCHGCCARHGRKRTSASITVPVYGDTAHSRRHVTARPTSKKGGTLISLRILWIQNTSTCGSRPSISCAFLPVLKPRKGRFLPL